MSRVDGGASPGRHATGTLQLGSGVVGLLLPHRRPMLMVDRVEDFTLQPTPRLVACRHISVNETFFEGHLPGLPLWPGALTLEGLAQAANLVLALTSLLREAETRGEDPEVVLESLRNLDRGFRLHPGHRPDEASALRARLAERARPLGMVASVEMKFLRPVLPGCELVYTVEVTADLRDYLRFGATAAVNGEPVAQGTITAAVRPGTVAPS